MPVNSLENAIRYTGELDQLYEQKSVTGFFLDNALRARFVGAKTVMIAEMDLCGLTDYDRDNGFTRGPISVSNTPFTMSMDRARSVEIDKEDADETGVANLAGKVLGNLVKYKVVPESDAYCLSKLLGVALNRGNLVDGDAEKPYQVFTKLVQEVQNEVGYDEELVAFIDGDIMAAFENSTEISKRIIVSEFKQGEINLKVKKINGVTLIPVVSNRFKSGYVFKRDNVGGFVPLPTAKQGYMLVMPKSGAHLVKKTETMRVFSPEQNQRATAWKFDYRIYYDIFVKNSGLDAIWAWVSPDVEITTQPDDENVVEGSITEKLTVSATSDAGTVSYQWYRCETPDGANAKKVARATKAEFAIPTNLTEGTYYYFATVKVDGYDTSNTEVATVTVTAQ